jgi:hypothetical protein
MKPIVHLNGTSKDSLLQQYLDAGHALETALEAMHGAYPNGRDYYPGAAGAYVTARMIWDAHLAHVREALAECQATAEHIADQ